MPLHGHLILDIARLSMPLIVLSSKGRTCYPCYEYSTGKWIRIQIISIMTFVISIFTIYGIILGMCNLCQNLKFLAGNFLYPWVLLLVEPSLLRIYSGYFRQSSAASPSLLLENHSNSDYNIIWGAWIQREGLITSIRSKGQGKCEWQPIISQLVGGSVQPVTTPRDY